MTRRSKREIENALDGLGESEEFTLQDYMWADLKDYYGGRLSRGERRLLENPEEHLPPAAAQAFEEGSSQ